MSGEGDGERAEVLWCVRGEWRVDRAAVVAPAPGLVVVVMARGFEGEEADWAVLVEAWVVEEEVREVGLGCDCWVITEWALKAERKEDRNGRLVGISASVLGLFEVMSKRL